MPAPPAADSAFRVLFVCTGNICRSAFAQRLGHEWVCEALGEDVGAIEFSSAGTRAVVGSSMHPDTALVLRGYGVGAGDFRARQLTAEQLVQADLVLTMTRAHRKHVLGLAPRALARTFTLREAADLLRLVDEDGTELRGDFGGRARALVAALAGARPRRAAGQDDDVPDPIDRPAEVHEQAGELIVSALLPLLRRLAHLRIAGTPGTTAGSDGPAHG